MSRYKTIETEVEVDLDDFSDEELIDELQLRNSVYRSNVSCEHLLDTWLFNRDKFEEVFRDYCRYTIGKSF